MNLIQLDADYQNELIHRARKDILAFTLATKPDFRVNWHHRHIAGKLNAFVRGEIKFLMVFLPPRHGKSEMISRRLPAFWHGQFPDDEIMAASYLDTLAGDMTIDVQNVIDSPMYQKIFPQTKIWPPGTSYTKGTRNSSEHHIIGRRGKYRGQGVGGSFTGKGANCLQKGSTILTSEGELPIESLREKIGKLRIVGFDTHEKQLSYRNLEAWRELDAEQLVEVIYESGKKVRCTPDHRIYTTRGYQRADELQRGDRSPIAFRCAFEMQLLLKRLSKEEIRSLQSSEKGSSRLLLFKTMLRRSSFRKKPTKMFSLRQPCSYKDEKILQRVQTENQPKKIASKKVSDLQKNFCTLKSSNCDLLKTLRRASSFKKNERQKKSQVPTWAGIPPFIRQTKTFSNDSRRKSLCCLRPKRQICSSHQSQSIRQSDGKFNFNVSAMSHNTSQIRYDTVSSVTRSSVGAHKVYDIQVEGTRNFFAEGICVSNCVIIDDPIKGREIADSVAFRERLWSFYKEDLFTRLETNLQTGRKGQVLITLTRWHEDDLAGRLLDQMKKSPLAIQWDILNYPAIREDLDNPDDPREVGEPLWPDKYNLEQLLQIKESAGVRGWSSLYQQNPTPAGGALFNHDMFAVCEPPPKYDYVFITADTAYKDRQESDFTVFTAFGVLNKDIYVIAVWRKQIKSTEVEGPAESFIRAHMQYGYRGTYIEPKGHGIYLNQTFAKRGLAIPSEDKLKNFYADRRFDKVERANNVIPHLSHRKIYISKRIADYQSLITECLHFPKGKHDDFVDTLIDALKFVYGRSSSILDAL